MTDARTGSTRFVGASVGRKEDHRFLRGEGRYLADLADAGTLQVAFVRSPVAAADLLDVDTAAAAASRGVVAVLTGRELAAVAGPLPVLHEPNQAFASATAFRMAPPPVLGLATDRLRYVGEPVAAVVAASRALAEDAAERVVLRHRETEPALDAVAALAPGAPELYPETPGNLAASIAVSTGAPPTGGVTVEGTYRMGRHTGVPLETRGVVAEFDVRLGRVDLWTSSQIPFLVHRAVCAATGWPSDALRVAVPDVGGGFGPKANIYPEELVLAVLARRLRTRLAWVEDRSEHLVATAHSRDQVHHARLTVDGDGRILAYADEFVVDLGASNLWLAGVVANTAIHAHGPYRIPAMDIRGRAALTNKTPTSQYRGAGRPEACFALERSLDAAARRLGLTPFEIRRRNVLGEADLPYALDLPYRDGVPIVLDGRDYGAALDDAERLLPDEDVRAARAAAARTGARVGVGVAMFIEATGRGPFETARARLLPGGRVAVSTGAASAGQGHETTLAQIAADMLGLDPSDVTVVEGDTDLAPDGMGSFASRTAVVAGSAVRLAARDLCRLAQEDAAILLGGTVDGVEPVSGGFRSVAHDGTLSWADIAEARSRNGELADRPPLDVVRRFEPPTVTWTAGAHVALVEVDPELGSVRVLRYAVVDEGGVAINPRIVEGQVLGGVAQGIGGALLEELRFDERGQPTSTTFADYLLPAAPDVPPVVVRHRTVPSEANRLGLRGVGESGTIPVYAALASAVDDALGAAVHVDRTPITPDRLLALLPEGPR